MRGPRTETMHTYRLFYYWTERDTGGAHEVFVDVKAFTAADAVFQAELRINKESAREYVRSGDGWNKGEWQIDRYYDGIRRIVPLADSDERTSHPNPQTTSIQTPKG